MLDYLPTPVRHAVLMIAGILLTWAASKVTDLPAPLPEVGAVIVGMASLYLTNLTRQYGIGADTVEEVDDYWND